MFLILQIFSATHSFESGEYSRILTDIEEERDDDTNETEFLTSWDHPVLNDYRLPQSARMQQAITYSDSRALNSSAAKCPGYLI